MIEPVLQTSGRFLSCGSEICLGKPQPASAAGRGGKFGAKPVEFEKGKAAVAVGKKDRLVPTIETVIAAVEAGELDAVLAAMSKTAVLGKGKRAAYGNRSRNLCSVRQLSAAGGDQESADDNHDNEVTATHAA